ncbi:MAG: hypothetical protein EHM80_01935 [Nitrospiraceae bacterium]|nr:MAG: hypothetical protein EHM80_01935 [Nitrospiraceae bacterium]
MNRIIISAFAFLFCVGEGISLAAGGIVARIGDSGDSVELSQQIDGRTVVDTLPVYHAGNVRYFSAGIGIDERSAQYPPFSLKLVFTAGGKPFLAGVAVTIRPAKGGPPIDIPRDHVNGPWLFVELPSGTYHLTATHADRTQNLKGVTVKGGKMKTVYLRWPEERESAALSGEAIGQ